MHGTGSGLFLMTGVINSLQCLGSIVYSAFLSMQSIAKNTFGHR